MIRHHTMINGMDVEAVYSQRAVDEIFLPLLRSLTLMQNQKAKRILAMLAAPPGAGKSTLLSFLSRLSREHEGICPIQTVGMDGFHRRQEYLLSHSVLHDGRQLPMVEIKGAPITFDLEQLKKRIRRIAAGDTVNWPVYDRMLHNPVENAIRIDGDIVLLEGNYLLLDQDGWRDVSADADYTISVTAEAEMLRTRLIDRRIKTGVEKNAAVRFVDFSDMPNVYLCLEKTKPADLQLRIDATGDYHKKRTMDDEDR